MNSEITINPNRIDLDEAYMQMAEVWARRSKANRLQVGALIVKDRQIISDGYNGMPAGDQVEVCEEWVDGALRTKRACMHAESNALMKLAENGGIGAQGATIYTTQSPCFDCAKLICQAKIGRVVYRNVYRDGGGIPFMQQRGVKVDHLPPKTFDVAPPIQQVVTGPVAMPLNVAIASDVPSKTPPAGPSMLQQIASPNSDIISKLRSQQPPPTPSEVPEKEEFALPPLVQPEGAASEAEVAALLAQYQTMINPKATAAKSSVENTPDEPYRSTFL